MIRLDSYTQLIHHLATFRLIDRQTQSRIASLLGVADATIGHWETGHRITPGNDLFRWAEAEKCTLYIAREQPK